MESIKSMPALWSSISIHDPISDVLNEILSKRSINISLVKIYPYIYHVDRKKLQGIYHVLITSFSK